MSFSLVKSECVDMTLDLVKKFRDMEPSPTEREMDPKRVKHLRDKATAQPSLLVTFHWASAKLPNGRHLRMNGQHSSEMLANLDAGTFPTGLKCHLDEYHVESEQDLALLFRQFDDRRSSRGPADVAGAYQGLYPEVREVPRVAAKLAIDGIAWYLRTIEGAPVPSGDSVYMLFEKQTYWPFIKWVGELLSIKTPELRRPQIAAAMYATWITANPDDCKKFWLTVAKGGDEYAEGDPQAALDGWYTGIKKKEQKEPPKPAELYQAAIYCWNAWVQQKVVKTVRVDMSKGWLSPLAA